MHAFHSFKKTTLAMLVASSSLSQLSYSQTTGADTAEEVIVTGVRAAQEKAIDIKRKSSEVVDSIAAEDVGKLPDSTISDSLQRVTGVQIQRSAGQGALVSKSTAPPIPPSRFLALKDL